MARVIERYSLGQLLDKFRSFGAWPDKCHFAFQHVEDLRQLVDACSADERAYPRYPAVILGCPARFTVTFGIHAHAAKLQNAKGLAMQAHPLLAEKHGRPEAVLQPDGQCSDQHYRPGTHEQDKAGSEVKRTFAQGIGRSSAQALGEIHPGGAGEVDQDLAGLLFEKIHQIEYLDTLQAAFDQLLFVGVFPVLVKRDEDLVNLRLLCVLREGLPQVDNTLSLYAGFFVIDAHETDNHEPLSISFTSHRTGDGGCGKT